MLFFMVVGEAPPPRRFAQAPIDEGLFPRIGRGDPEALAELYRLTQRSVYAYALSLLRRPEDALDVVQDTYLKVRAAAHLYEPQGKPLAWLFTIARNLAKNRLRREGRSVPAEEAGLEDDLRLSYVADPTDRLVLEAALTILGEEEREILLLHAVSGVRHRQIAASLGLPLSTVLSKYSRAIQKLRRHLEKQGVSR